MEILIVSKYGVETSLINLGIVSNPDSLMVQYLIEVFFYHVGIFYPNSMTRSSFIFDFVIIG